VGDKLLFPLQKEHLTGTYRNILPLLYGNYTATKALGENDFELNIPPFLAFHLLFNVDLLLP
jgi:hypothetical protein